MLRKPATTVHLGQEDVADLIAELEEEKLQLRIQSQKKNLIRSGATVVASAESGKGTTEDMEPGSSEDASIQISPLDGKRLRPDQADEGPPTATLTWLNRQVQGHDHDRDRYSEENPFYRDGDV